MEKQIGWRQRENHKYGFSDFQNIGFSYSFIVVGPNFHIGGMPLGPVTKNHVGKISHFVLKGWSLLAEIDSALLGSAWPGWSHNDTVIVCAVRARRGLALLGLARLFSLGLGAALLGSVPFGSIWPTLPKFGLARCAGPDCGSGEFLVDRAHGDRSGFENGIISSSAW